MLKGTTPRINTDMMCLGRRVVRAFQRTSSLREPVIAALGAVEAQTVRKIPTHNFYWGCNEYVDRDAIAVVCYGRSDT